MLIHKMGWFFQKVLYPQLTWRKDSTDEKIIYLTFDDGPIPEMTPTILDLLKQYNAKATFFCVGDNIRKHPSIFKRTQEEGHSVGNHTYNHLNGWQTKDVDYLQNVEKCTAVMREHLPEAVSEKMLFRPPYGRISKSQISKLLPNYHIVMWEVLSGDFLQSLSSENCLKKSIKYTESGSIVVFHDNIKAKRNVDEVLPRYLEHFAQLGFEFKAL